MINNQLTAVSKKIFSRPKLFKQFIGMQIHEFEKLNTIFSDSFIFKRKLGRAFSLSPTQSLFIYFLTLKCNLTYEVSALFLGMINSTVYRNNQRVVKQLSGLHLFDKQTQQLANKYYDEKTPEEKKKLNKIINKALNIKPLNPKQTQEAIKILKEWLIIDATEIPIKRPKDIIKQKNFYSGKKKRHTIKKTLIKDNYGFIVNPNSSYHDGKHHDKKN